MLSKTCNFTRRCGCTMARSIITPAHMEEKGKKIKVGYPPALCLILRRLSAIRLVRDAKHLFRVCRLEGCARHATLVTTLRGPPPGALAGYRREATEIREKRFSIRGNSIGISPFSLRCARGAAGRAAGARTPSCSCPTLVKTGGRAPGTAQGTSCTGPRAA